MRAHTPRQGRSRAQHRRQETPLQFEETLNRESQPQGPLDGQQTSRAETATPVHQPAFRSSIAKMPLEDNTDPTQPQAH